MTLQIFIYTTFFLHLSESHTDKKNKNLRLESLNMYTVNS